MMGHISSELWVVCLSSLENGLRPRPEATKTRYLWSMKYKVPNSPFFDFDIFHNNELYCRRCDPTARVAGRSRLHTTMQGGGPDPPTACGPQSGKRPQQPELRDEIDPSRNPCHPRFLNPPPAFLCAIHHPLIVFRGSRFQVSRTTTTTIRVLK